MEEMIHSAEAEIMEEMIHSAEAETMEEMIRSAEAQAEMIHLVEVTGMIPLEA